MRAPKEGDSPSGYDREIRPRVLPDTGLPRDLALGAAGVAVIKRSRALPAKVHTEDPRTVLSRIMEHPRERPYPWRDASYDEAVHMAALWTVLAAAIDRAETASPTSGDDEEGER